MHSQTTRETVWRGWYHLLCLCFLTVNDVGNNLVTDTKRSAHLNGSFQRTCPCWASASHLRHKAVPFSEQPVLFSYNSTRAHQWNSGRQLAKKLDEALNPSMVKDN